MKHEEHEHADLERSLERYRQASAEPSTERLRARLIEAGLPLDRAMGSDADDRAAGRVLPFALRLIGFAAIVLVALWLGLRDHEAPRTLHAAALDAIVVERNGARSTQVGDVYLCAGDVLRPASAKGTTLRCCKTGSEIRFGRRAWARFVRWQKCGTPLFDLSSGDIEVSTKSTSFDFEVQGTRFRCTNSACKLVKCCAWTKDGAVQVTATKGTGVVMLPKDERKEMATTCQSHKSVSCGKCDGCGIRRH